MQSSTHIQAFEGESQEVWFEDNCQGYEADRKRRIGVDVDQPHRIKYRKLTRQRQPGRHVLRSGYNRAGSSPHAFSFGPPPWAL